MTRDEFDRLDPDQFVIVMAEKHETTVQRGDAIVEMIEEEFEDSVAPEESNTAAVDWFLKRIEAHAIEIICCVDDKIVCLEEWPLK